MKSFVFIESNTTGSGLEFFERVRRLGLIPVLLTASPDRWRRVEDAACVRESDTSSIEAIESSCHDLDVAGVWSSSDPFIGTAARFARRRGLPGPDPDAIERNADKSYQRRVLAKAGLSQPQLLRLDTPTSPIPVRLRYPVVAKPISGSGKVGVRICRSKAELTNHLDTLAAGCVLLEEFVVGAEFSIEVFDGKPLAVVKKHNRLPGFLELGHDLPSGLAVVDEERLKAVAELAAKALHLAWGPIHVEAKLPGPGKAPVVIETNARLAGGSIPALCRGALGIDLVAATINRCLGETARLEILEHPVPHAIRFFEGSASGDISQILGTATAKELPGVVQVVLFKQPGDHYIKCDDFRSRIGLVLARGATLPAATKRALRAIGALQICIDGR